MGRRGLIQHLLHLVMYSEQDTSFCLWPQIQDNQKNMDLNNMQFRGLFMCPPLIRWHYRIGKAAFSEKTLKIYNLMWNWFENECCCSCCYLLIVALLIFYPLSSTKRLCMLQSFVGSLQCFAGFGFYRRGCSGVGVTGKKSCREGYSRCQTKVTCWSGPFDFRKKEKEVLAIWFGVNIKLQSDWWVVTLWWFHAFSGTKMQHLTFFLWFNLHCFNNAVPSPIYLRVWECKRRL